MRQESTIGLLERGLEQKRKKNLVTLENRKVAIECGVPFNRHTLSTKGLQKRCFGHVNSMMLKANNVERRRESRLITSW